METIQFRGVKIRYFDERRESETGLFTRIHLSADPSDPVFEAMGWEKIPDCIGSGKLTGSLVARDLVLTPVDPALRKQAFQLTCIEVSDFFLARVKEDDGESKVAELRFIVRSQAAQASALLSAYWRVLGDAPAMLTVDYSAAKREVDLKKTEPEMPLFDAAEGQKEEVVLSGGAKGKKPGMAEFVLKDDEGKVIRRFDTLEELQRATAKQPKPTALPTAREAAGRTPHLRGRKPGAKGKQAVKR